jgi:hypothetical protein
MSACSSDAPPTITGPSTTTPRATTTTQGSTESTAAVASEEDTIKSQYLAFWDTRFALNESPPSTARTLEEVATGAQLQRASEETAANRSAGLAFRRPEKSVARRTVEVRDVVGDLANVSDCAVSDGIVYRVVTGEVVSSAATTRSIDAVMRRVDGAWKVETTKVLQQWEGVAGCALAS